MLHRLWRVVALPLMGVTAILAGASPSLAQVGIANISAPKTAPPAHAPVRTPTSRPSLDAPRPTDNSATDDLRLRVDRLEKQNQELLEALRNLKGVPTTTTDGSAPLNTADVQKIIGDYLATKEKTPPASTPVGPPMFTVGSNLGMVGVWKNHQPWLESTDKSFRFHLGGRAQYDIVATGVPENVQFAPGGIGAYNDGVNFRRARLTAEGTFWEQFAFVAEFDFVNSTQAINAVNFNNLTTANNTFNTPVPTDLWIQMSHLPVIGNIRVGNQKPWINFEHMTSSRFLNFLERSLPFDSFIEDGNNGFTSGISAWDTWGPEDGGGMWGIGLYKNTRAIFGWNVGEGEWQGTGRATWLPVYRDDGRRLVHLAMGAQFRDLDESVIRLRSRSLLRQAPLALHNIVAIAQTNGNSQLLLNPEFVVNHGPFTLQTEYMFSQVYGVTNVIRTPTQINAPIAKQNFNAQGFNIEALYFLTGEHRAYDKKNGGFTRVVPNRNYFFLRGEEGERLLQGGAWQVGVRYCYLDLNDGPIRGGQVNDVTIGLNWFLNPNFKIQGNYSYGYRTVDAPSNGSFQGFGIRFAFDW